jgi:carbamoyl-phosphate synthase large subunit
MRSTGEVMSFGDSFPESFAKSQIAAGNPLPTEGTVLASLSDSDKQNGIPLVAQLHDWGFKIIATGGTARMLRAMSIPCDEVFKVGEARPDVVDVIAQGGIDLVINTPSSSEKVSMRQDAPLPAGAVERGLPLPLESQRTVGYKIRTAALDYHIPYVTTLVALRATVAAIRSIRSGQLPVRTLADVTAHLQE